METKKRVSPTEYKKSKRIADIEDIIEEMDILVKENVKSKKLQAKQTNKYPRNLVNFSLCLKEDPEEGVNGSSKRMNQSH